MLLILAKPQTNQVFSHYCMLVKPLGEVIYRAIHSGFCIKPERTFYLQREGRCTFTPQRAARFHKMFWELVVNVRHYYREPQLTRTKQKGLSLSWFICWSYSSRWHFILKNKAVTCPFGPVHFYWNLTSCISTFDFLWWILHCCCKFCWFDDFKNHSLSFSI